MALRQTFTWLYTLAVFSLSASQDETLSQSCNPPPPKLLEQLSSNLRMAVECNFSSNLNAQQTASLLLSMKSLTEILHNGQLAECKGKPENCSDPEVPDNGGLACMTVNGRHFCKPLCNHGHDFAFLRRTRVYEECSEQTGYKWTTQYIGGNKLAICHKSLIQVSGVPAAYFPTDQDCLITKSNSQLQEIIFQQFTNELKAQGIEEEPQYKCLVCGY